MSGDPNLVRIGTGMVGDEESSCPSSAAAKARPAVQPQLRQRSRRPGLETFALGPVMAALDGVEFDGMSVVKALGGLRDAQPRLHPGLLLFAQHAVRCYLQAAGPEGDSGQKGGLEPVRDLWVVQRISGRTWELYAWGRRYQSPDGRLREFRFLRHGEAGARQRDPAQVAIAGYSAAFGVLAPWPQWWSRPFQLRGDQGVTVEEIRVVEVGLVDGSRAELFAGTPAQVEAYYAAHGRPRVAKVAAGGPPVPGMSCASCKQLTVCAELPRLPGLLGLEAGETPLRTVSISELRAYRSCPAQAHLSNLHLPGAHHDQPEADLGRAVHGWLETVHSGGIPAACSIAEMPPDGDALLARTAGRWELTAEAAQLGVRMLAHHPDVCPFQHAASIHTVRVEPRLVLHDPTANAIVIARPDMLYLQDGSWIWHEVKTTQKRRWTHEDLLEEFPQLALGVVLLADGALGGDPSCSRVELEMLRPDGADIQLIDPADPRQAASARVVLQDLARTWREDEAFEARPGKACRWCRVSKWCPSFPGEDAHDDHDEGASL